MRQAVDSLAGIAKSAGLVFLGTILGRAFALVGQILIIRLLRPEVFGEIALTLSVATTIGGLAALGLHQGVARLSAGKGPNESLGYASTAAMIAIASGLIVTVLTVAFRGEIATAFGEPAIASLLPLFAVFIAIHPVSRVAVGTLRGQHRSGAAVLSRDLVGKAAGFVAFGVLALLGQVYLGAVWFWAISPVATVIVAGYFLSSDLDALSQAVSYDSDRLKRLVSFSWPLALETAFVVLMLNVDILLVGYLSTTADVGVYRAVQPLATLLLIVLNSFVFLYLPLATQHYEEHDHRGLERVYVTTTKWMTNVSFPVLLTFVFFSPDVIRMFYSADTEYVVGATTFAVLSLGMFLRVMAGPTGTTVMAIDRTRFDLLASGAGLLANVGLNVYLVPRYGIVGAAAATGIGFAVFNVVELVVIYRTVSIHPFSLGLFKPLIPTALVAGGLGWLLADINVTPIDPLAVGVILAVTHLLSLIVTRSFDATDRLLVAQAERKLGIDLTVLRRFS